MKFKIGNTIQLSSGDKFLIIDIRNSDYGYFMKRLRDNQKDSWRTVYVETVGRLIEKQGHPYTKIFKFDKY
jgi:hypothetical protein